MDVERLNEKAMFTNISWSNYIIAVSVLLLIWYLYLIFQYYNWELKQIISGKQKINLLNFRGKNKKEFISSSLEESVLEPAIFLSQSDPFDTLDDTHELSERLLKAISESVERNLSREEFQNYLIILLDEYPFVRVSTLRDKINQLIVSESERYPNLHLTYTQTDRLWDVAT